MLCRWLLVAACIDRMLICSSNANLRRCSTVRMSRFVSFVITIIWLILPLHTLVSVDVYRRDTLSCFFTETGVAIYHGFYTFFMGALLPPIIMILCVTKIWKNLRERTARRNVMQVDRRNNQRDDYQIIFILFVQVAIFLISSVPSFVFTLYLSLILNVRNKSENRIIIEQIIQLVTDCFLYIFPGSLFYSSTLVSKSFRDVLFKILSEFLVCRVFQKLQPKKNNSALPTITLKNRQNTTDSSS